MSKRKNGYNLIITDSTFGEIFSLYLGIKRLIFLIAFFTATPIALVAVLVFAPRIFRNVDDVVALEKENRVLRATVDSIETIKKSILEIDKYSNYLRSAALLKGGKPLPSLHEYMKSDSLKKVLVTSSSADEVSSIPSLKPVVGGIISRSFKKGEHEAVDISSAEGKSVLASANGVVQEVYWDESLGHVIIVDHGGEYTTEYAHCKSIIKQKGSKVMRGEPIATVGSTGKESTGPHVHFVVKNRDGASINPELLFNK